MVLNLVQFQKLAVSASDDSRLAVHDDLMVDLLRSFPEGAEAANAKAAWATAAAELLTTTPSNRIRNAAALALADLGAVECSQPIVEMLRRPDIAKTSGTLLYALNELGASIPLDVFTHVIEHGSFEGRSEALALLDDDKVQISDGAEFDKALHSLDRLASDPEDLERAEAAKLAALSLRDHA